MISEELRVLKIISQRLEEAGIPYMLTGSTAMNYYATPRMTRDLDLVIELKASDIQNLVHEFHKDFYIDPDAITEALEHQSMFNIIHNEWVIKVDFILRKQSPYHQLEFERRKKVKIKDFEFWIVSAEDLILSKLNWAKESMSDFQLRDVQNLLQGIEKIDLDYIKKWVINLKLEVLYQKVRQ